ncbi:uncharacterized protein LOC132546542 [Ylistrum balloti]|uniref:uncharacterized protein LOC132546542 n=1 Tax=Ylistrum balloti TaxID=509963 RepID=UPI002905DE72|nr:uncharacterized protein LOC132546542 [Ylistrum balloti]
MALKPFFSCMKGRQFSINPKKNKVDKTFIECRAGEVFSGSNQISETTVSCFRLDMERHPPSKRRKTDEGYQGEATEQDEWDDDDFDLQLTQAELEHIDTMASQAITQPQTSSIAQVRKITKEAIVCADQNSPRPPPHKSPAVPLPTGSQGSFVKPQNISSNNSSSSSRNTSLSLSSRNNSMSSYSSSSSYPVTPRSAGSHQSSSSLRSDSSVEMVVGHGQLSRKSNTTSSANLDSQSLEVSTRSFHGDMVRHRRDSTDINAEPTEMQEIKKELFQKDGEIKILRDTLQKKEGEITQAKKEKMQAINQQQREQSEHEKYLQASVDRLNTQLQFKDRDITELQERCRSFEARQQSAEGGYISSSPRKVIVPQHSPKPHRNRSHSPVGNVGFPTQHSFMADDRSPKAKSQLSVLQKENKNTKDIGTCTVGVYPPVATPRSTSPSPVTRYLRRRLFLSTADHPTGVLSGPQLVSSLLEASPCGGGVDQGIVGLLHMHTGNCDLQRLHFDRDNSSSILSPLPNRQRPFDPKVSPKKWVSVGSSEHRTLALQGMQTLLHNRQSGDNFIDKVSVNVLRNAAKSDADPKKHLADTSLVTRNKEKVSTDQDIPTDYGAVLLLPLLADYLGHYQDLLTCAVEVSPQSPPSSRGSSSLDSSVESLSSSLSLLLRDSALFANNLEALALAALSILHRLVSYCPSVRAVLFESPESNATTSVHDATNGQMAKHRHGGDDGSNHDTDISSSGSCSRSQGSGIHQYVEDIYLLRKIFSLANPGQGVHRYNVHIVERALDILIVLATHLEEDQVQQLLPLLHNSVLANCLECDNDKSVVIRGLKLLTTLVKFNSFVSSLYVGPDGCLLCLLYNVCIGPVDEVSSEYRLQTSTQLFHCLYNIISVHKGGAVLLLQSDCRCSVQVIRTVVVVLHRLLLLYEEREKDGSKCEEENNLLVPLSQGVLLLHTLYQKDDRFSDHRFLVEHQYVRLVTGLTSVFKHLTANNSHELSALGELWDFDDEYNEFSQESEGDEEDLQQMDVS